MIEEREFEGRDLEQALRAASAVLGIPEPDLDYEIVEQGRRGLFGVGARSVRIRVMPPLGAMPEPLAAGAEPAAPSRPASRAEASSQRDPRGPRPARERRAAAAPEGPAPGREAGARPDRADVRAQARPAFSEASASEIVRTLQRILDLMGLELAARRAASTNGVVLELEGPDRATLTEKDGDLLHALQFLLNRMARRAWPDAGPIQLSCNGEEQAGRDEEVVRLTREVAEQVSRTGRTKRLHPMNAYERRLVHLTVREYEQLGSRSEGAGHLKRVKIFKQG